MEGFKSAADRALASLFKTSSTITSPLNAAIAKAASESAARLAREKAAEEAARKVPLRQRFLKNAAKREQRLLERRQVVRAERREFVKERRNVGAYNRDRGGRVEVAEQEQEEGLVGLVGKYKLATTQLLASMEESGDEVSPELREAIEGIEKLVENKEMFENEEEVLAIMERFEKAIRTTKEQMMRGGTSLEDVERGEKAMEKLEEAGVLDELMSLPPEKLEKKLAELSKEQSWPQMDQNDGGGAGSGMFGGRSKGERKFDPNAEPTIIYEDKIIEPSEKVQQLIEQFEKDLLEDYKMLRKEESEVEAGIRSMLTDELASIKFGSIKHAKLNKVIASRPELRLDSNEAIKLHHLAQCLFYNVYNKEKQPKEVFVRLKRIATTKRSNLKYLSPKAWEWLWNVAGVEARLDDKGKFDPKKPIAPTNRQIQLGDYMRACDVEMTFDQFSKYIVALVWAKERKEEAVETWQERLDKDPKDPLMWSLGIRMFSMMGDPSTAEETLRAEEAELGKKTPSHFVPVIAFYNLTGRPEEGWRLYDEMREWEKKTGEKVDVLKYAVVTESFLVAKQFDEGLRAFKDMLNARAQTPEELEYLSRFQELVRMALAAAETPRQLNALADTVMSHLPSAVQDNAFYSAWIRGLAKNRRWDLALNLLKRRAKTHKYPVHTDDVDALIKCFLECGLEKEALCMVTEMVIARLDYLKSDIRVELPCIYTPEERAELGFKFPSASQGTFSIVLSHLKNRGMQTQIHTFLEALKACRYTPDCYILNHLLVIDIRLSSDSANSFLDLFTDFVKPPVPLIPIQPSTASPSNHGYPHGNTTPDRETITLLWHWASRHFSRNSKQHPSRRPSSSYVTSRWSPTPSELYQKYTAPFLPSILAAPHTISHERNLLKLLTLAFVSHGTLESLRHLSQIFQDFATTWGVVGDAVWLKGRVNRMRGMGYRVAKEGMVSRRDSVDGDVVVRRVAGRQKLSVEEAERVLVIEGLVGQIMAIVERSASRM